MSAPVRLLVFFWFALLFSFPGFSQGMSASAGQTRSRLEIFPLDGGPMIYEGDRVTTEENGRVKVVVVYRKVGGAPFLTEEWAFENATLNLHYQKLTNLVTGRRESMVQEGDTVNIEYQENSKAPVKQAKLKMDETTLHSGMLASLLKQNWERLEKGEVLTFDLLVPSRMEALGFRVRKDSFQEIAGESVMVLLVEPRSWMVRKFLNPFYFYHSRKPPHRLLESRGRSPIHKDNGETQDLRTVYIPVKG